MGSGKTTTGEILAQKLDYCFVDLDVFVENKCQKSIKQMFSEGGELLFRNIESDCLDKVSNLNDKCVISTGGGVVLSQLNWKLMNSSGTTFYLKVDIDTAWNRIKSSEVRPLLNVANPLDEARKLFAERITLYERSDFTVNTNGFSADKVADEVVDIVKKHR